MSEKLTKEQLAKLIQSASGSAKLAGEDVMESHTNQKNYSKNVRDIMSRLKDQDPATVRQAGELVYPKPVQMKTLSSSELDDLASFLGEKSKSSIDNVVPMARKAAISELGDATASAASNKMLAKLGSKYGAASLGGVVGLGLAGAAEASDAPEAGDSSAQAALLRDYDASSQQKQIESSDSVPDNVKLEALRLFKKNRLPYDR